MNQEDKYCLACGDTIEKGKTEAKHVYKKRKFCSTFCSKAYLKKTKSGWFSSSKSGLNRDQVDEDTYDRITNREHYAKFDEAKRLGDDFEEQLIRDLTPDFESS